MKCPLCRGEKQLSYIPADDREPARLGSCYKCRGKGFLVVSELTDDNFQDAIPITSAKGTSDE